MLKQNLNLKYFSKNLSTVIGIVLIWRGVWYTLDYLDIAIFGGSHAFTAIGGIIVGLVVIYLPDGDLKEISKL